MRDPLAGKREALNRGEIGVLTWPHEQQPVNKGDLFQLRSCLIEIESVDRALIKGEWIWRAKVIRHVPDRPRLLANQHGRIPHSYVDSLHAAMPDDVAVEGVPEDYQRRLVEEGRMKTALEGAGRRQQAEVIRQERRLAEVRDRQMSGAARLVESRLEKLRDRIAA